MNKYEGCNWVQSAPKTEVVKKSKRKRKINMRLIIAAGIFALCFGLIKFTPPTVSEQIKAVLFYDFLDGGEVGDSCLTSLFS